MTVVIAQDYKQYNYYCRTKGIHPEELNYIGPARHLRGLNPTKIIVLNGWANRPRPVEDIEYINWFIQHSQTVYGTEVSYEYT